MAVPIEAFTVVLQASSVDRHLADGAATLHSMAPNGTLVSDGEISRLAFMMADDAGSFCTLLETHGFRFGTDMAIVTSDQIETHGHSWLVLAALEESVIAALRGTRVQQIFAPEGWTPQRPTQLERLSDEELAEYDMVDKSAGVTTWRHQVTGEVRYSASPKLPHVVLFERATSLAGSLVQLDGPPMSDLTSVESDEIQQAIGLLAEAVELAPHYWQAWWFLGKFHQRTGDEASSLNALRKSAHACGSEDVNTWREYAAACARVGVTDEGITAAEMATEIEPGNAGLVSNLALAHLLAGNVHEAQAFIQQAESIDPGHPVTAALAGRIDAVANGELPQPRTMADLMGDSPRPRKRWGRRKR